MKKTVALIYGGEGCERQISCLTAKNIFAAIDKNKYEILPIFISAEGNWYKTSSPSENIGEPTYPVRINSQSGFLENGKILPVSVAIIALHGDFGEDGRIQGALDSAHVKYIGCGVFAGSIASDKICTKAIAQSLGILTARWIYAKPGESADSLLARAEKAIGYPMFIKPSSLGSSIGAHKVFSREEFADAFADAKALGGERVLIEEYIDSVCEIECGFYECDRRIISPGGIVTTEGKFYDFKRKYEKDSDVKASHGADLDSEYNSLAKRATEALCDILSLKHISRIDFLLSKDGKLYFNEINTFPGMTDTSLYPLIIEDSGISKEEQINRLIAEVAK